MKAGRRTPGRPGKGDERLGTQVSVVMPAYNEADNLVELVPETTAALRDAGLTYEVVVVDDGSTDRTGDVMRRLEGGGVVNVCLRRNAGKSAALDAGLARVQGEYVVLMDADGQDDPRQIPRLLAALDGDDDLDLVTGRRAVRHDRFVKRTTSRLYNRTTSMVVSASGRRTTLSPLRTTEAGTSMARRAKCAALCSLGAASSIVSSGHTRSMICSRWRRRSGAMASTFTSAAA